MVAAAGIVLFGPVHRAMAAATVVRLLAGSFFGPSLTRRLKGEVLRWAGGSLGLGLATWLFIVNH